MPQFEKTKFASEVLDYVFNWTTEGYLTGSETISSSSWTVASGLTKDSESNTTTTTTVWVSGGTAGEAYKLTNRITTSTTREAERSFFLYVK